MKALDLRGRRQNADVRIEPVAAAVGCHNNTLTDIERGRIGIDVETYNDIVSAIDRLSPAKAGKEAQAA